MLKRQQFTNGKSRASGFTLAEVIVSMAVLTVGLLGIAALIGSTLNTGTQAKYMNMANILASNKLDSLNKWPSSDENNDPNIAPGGALAGPDVCDAGDNYCDQITLSETSGANYETQTVNGVTTTIVHTKTGCVDTPANCGVPDTDNNGSKFTRRWLITLDPTIASSTGTTTTVSGARRITVMVSLNNPNSKNPVRFQMSMVRP
ncbi:MAG TPA: prepilin-type N-terminal cleavage/methylation domain-containing protein [Candidatus Saccharimonadales bacterium]|nr:prepilin-type N-terminal cleavage/methylation domain-containing protein [Candidatus Saccharimonadales bacterium]